MKVSTVRIGNVWSIPNVFDSLGLATDPMLKARGLSRELFDQPEAVIPYAAIDELIACGARESGCDHLGLLIGMQPPELGLPAFLLFNAPDVRTGLTALMSSFDRIDSGGVATLDVFGDTATLGYAIVAKNLLAADQICDLSIAAGYGLLKRLVGPKFVPTEIRLPRRPPADKSRHHEFFCRGRIKFDALDAAIEFSASCLEAPISNADPALYRFLTSLSTQNQKTTELSMAGQIRRVLPYLVRRQEINSENISRMFGIHPRTMARRLSAENITLHALVEEARFEVARQLLRDTDRGVTGIAADLYYADASAFTRAFKRKFGAPPGVWRRKRHRDDTPR